MFPTLSSWRIYTLIPVLVNETTGTPEGGRSYTRLRDFHWADAWFQMLVPRIWVFEFEKGRLVQDLMSLGFIP
jgi:hypothetical protein